MYAQATRTQFRQRRYSQPFPLHTHRGRKGLQKGLYAQNEKCDCIKYLKLGDLPAITEGTIVHEYDGTHYEVEFFDADGNTIDVITTPASVLELLSEV